MSNFLVTDYPIWFILFCLLLGIGYAFVLYRNERNITPKLMIYVLATVRAILVSLIAFFLIVPIIKKKNTEEIKPMIAFVEDNSISIEEHTSKEELSLYQKNRDVLLDRLTQKYEVLKFSFGESLNSWQQPTYTEKITNISKSLNELKRQMLNNKVGGVVLATDGIYNEGNNPLYESATFQTSFYTIGLGDTSVRRDLKIAQLRYNNIVYLGDLFQLEIDISANNLEGKSTTLQVINEDGRVIFSDKIEINSSSFFKTNRVNIEAAKVGVVKYKVTASAVEGEVTVANNTAWVYVDVLEGKQKVLVLYDAPHPDIKAIGRIVEEQKNYEFTAERINRFKGKLEDYNCVIMHGLPSEKFNLNNIGVSLQSQNIWYIVSLNTDLNQLNALQNTVRIISKSNQKNEVLGYFNKSFGGYVLPENLNQMLSRFPPVIVPFAEYGLSAGSSVVLFQKIGSVETDYPLLTIGNQSGIKTAVLAGEGIWRWFVYDNKEVIEEGAFKEVFGKTIRYLSLKEDKRKFRLNIPQNILGENKNIMLTAELYNDNFEPITTPDVSLRIQSDRGEEYVFVMDKYNTYYSLNAGKLPVGDYNITATTRFNNQDYKATGKLSIEPVLLEQVNTQANHQLLRLMANSTGGQYFNAAEMLQLEQYIMEDIQMKPILSESFRVKSLLDLKWLFFLILSLLTFEWISRKWLGVY